MKLSEKTMVSDQFRNEATNAIGTKIKNTLKYEESRAYLQDEIIEGSACWWVPSDVLLPSKGALSLIIGGNKEKSRQI